SLLVFVHAVEILPLHKELDEHPMRQSLRVIRDAVLSEFEFVIEARPLEQELRHFIERIQQRHWPLSAEV
ncbi:histidine ammonia-lyase, partial [Vibrio parahaemolyticus]|nr:histidine ammonia-lyase [Vibrio parahaemolyticus]